MKITGNDENSIPDKDAHLIDPHGSWMTNKRESQQPRKPKSRKQSQAVKKSINDTTLPSARLSSGVSVSSKLRANIPSQMKEEPLYDTSAFQFIEEVKHSAKNEEGRALGDISANVINARDSGRNEQNPNS